MRLNGRISGFSYFCVVPTALGSLIPSYPALKRWAKLRRPLHGLCFYLCRRFATCLRMPSNPALTCWAIEITSLRDLARFFPARPTTQHYVLGYRDNVASRLGKNKTPTSAKKGQMWDTFRFLVPSLRNSSAHAQEPSTYVLGYRDNVASRLTRFARDDNSQFFTTHLPAPRTG